MARTPRVLIDLNLVLDVLQKREPFYAASAGVLACAETGLVEGFVAAHTLTTLFYLLAKDQSAERHGLPSRSCYSSCRLHPSTRPPSNRH